MPTTKETGQQGEDLAVAFLEAKGYTVLDRNYRFEREELDVICLDPGKEGPGGGPPAIVFVEVKARRGTGYGRPEAAVTPAKQKAIARVAQAYLHERRLEGAMCRFDVVAVLFGTGEPGIEHFEHAFWA
jgi:putative endonuclease